MPLVAAFLRRARPEAVRETSTRLSKSVFALAVENGYNDHGRYRILEAAWMQIAAALPVLQAGENARLQIICEALANFLRFSGRFDEAVSLFRHAEAASEAAHDFRSAGWLAAWAGSFWDTRRSLAETRAAYERAEAHWQKDAGPRERAEALRLRGTLHLLAKDYPAAIAATAEAIELDRGISPASKDVAGDALSLANAYEASGDLAAAERAFREVLRISEVGQDAEGVAQSTLGLASVAGSQSHWPDAELFAAQALALAESWGRKDLVAGSSCLIALAQMRQGRPGEALAHAQRAVDLYAELQSPEVEEAQAVVEECQS